MHSIASFCRERRLPQRRVLREVKRALRDHVDLQTRGWKVDLSEQIGVEAHRAEGAKRVTYAVTDPEVLWRWLAAEVGPSLLTAKQLEQIAAAARYYHSAATKDEEFEWRLYHQNTGQAFSPKRNWFDELDAALKQMNM